MYLHLLEVLPFINVAVAAAVMFPPLVLVVRLLAVLAEPTPTGVLLAQIPHLVVVVLVTMPGLVVVVAPAVLALSM
jgi:hypothetical protein